ncbi:MAG TPA: ATP-binding protein [Rubrivivax sp.]|nr:ATP-binding protein [Rubrivivax sp.]
MDGGPGRLNASLQRRLALALVLCIGVVALVAGAFSFAAAYDEARELQDDVLLQVALLVDRQRLDPVPAAPDAHFKAHDDGTRVIVQRLGAVDPAGRHVDDGGVLPIPPTLADGLHTLELGGESFRVLVRTTAAGTRIAVAQESDLRDELAQGSALRTLLPFLVLVPVLLLLVARLVHTMFGPITALAQQVDARAEHDLQPMATHGLPAEVRPFVGAINRLLARVAQAMAVQQRFVADAAHELRSPLAALSLQAERLAQADMSAGARERLAALRQGIERGRRLVDQLLALARAQSAQATQAAAPVSVQRAFRQVLEGLMPLAEARAIDIGVEGAQDVQLRVAERDLHTLLRNLVDNAIRHTPEGGRVDLGVRTTAGAVVLSVRDTGPGIAPEERERVFDPFYRVPGSGPIGSGLGLSIVRAVAERIGASVRLDYSDAAQCTGLAVEVSLAHGDGP